MTTLLALLTNLLFSELCSTGENAVNLAAMGSDYLDTAIKDSIWIATNNMSATQIDDLAEAIASVSATTCEYVIETHLSLFAMRTGNGDFNWRTFKALLMVYTMPHPTHVYYRRPHVGIIPLTAQDHHCHTLR